MGGGMVWKSLGKTTLYWFFNVLLTTCMLEVVLGYTITCTHYVHTCSMCTLSGTVGQAESNVSPSSAGKIREVTIGINPYVNKGRTLFLFFVLLNIWASRDKSCVVFVVSSCGNPSWTNQIKDRNGPTKLQALNL